MTNLSHLKCKACTGDTPKLSEKDIVDNLKKINNWQVNDKQEMIFKKFTFKTFKKALDFANLIGKIAENEKHHPDIMFGWGYAKIQIYTHKIKGLVESDFILAAKIDKIKF